MTGKESYSESISDLLIATLASSRNVRVFRSILRERKLRRYKEESIRVALSRLQSRGYVKNSTSGWEICDRTKKYRKNYLLDYIPSPFSKHIPNMIVAFDIPEKNRRVRNWLRNQLKIFKYEMLQKSLWTGPGPLPSAFLQRLENFKIRESVKTFKITKRNS